jgi:DNA-damage-inducible protein J
MWYSAVRKGVKKMAQAMVNFRMDEDLKKRMESACKEMGMSMTTAFIIYATKVGKERRIPFEVTADPDPFYSDVNVERLKKAIIALNAGKGVEHELIEVD